MNEFARLFAALDETRKSEKLAALTHYFSGADDWDSAWAVWLLTGHRLKRMIPARRLATLAMETADIEPWLFDECYEAVGDLAETISLLVPAPDAPSDLSLHEWMESRILTLAAANESERQQSIRAAWRELDGTARLLYTKLITGEFRPKIPLPLVIRALSEVTGVPGSVLAHRLAQDWAPGRSAFDALRATDHADARASRPYPFATAHTLVHPASLGAAGDCLAEWTWDGLRVQLMRRGGNVSIWSHDGDLLTSRFPELVDATNRLPDGIVLEGELLPWRHGRVLSHADLQRRLQRQQATPRLLAEVPVVLITHDLLEIDANDIRDQPFASRRDRLRQVIAALSTPNVASSDVDLFGPVTDAIAGSPILTLPVTHGDSWDALHDELERARDGGAEGLLLRHRGSAYDTSAAQGDWWIWRSTAQHVVAVLMYVEAAHGGRDTNSAEYTFGVWREGQLIPFAKSSEGLSETEMRTIDNWARRHTVEKFGPVRMVAPEHVFEIGFERISRSTRHKSGLSVRRPRVVRWRTDLRAADAGTLESLEALIE